MVDPILAPVAADLLWRSLLDVAKYLIRVDSEAGARRELIAGAQTPDGTLADALELAGQRLTQPPAIDPAIGGEQLRRFLQSPDARALVRQIYASALTSASFDSLEQQFVAEFALWTGVSDEQADAHGVRLFRGFVTACQEVLEQAIEHNVLAAHEANSNLRHKLLSAQLEGINRHIASLTDRQRASHEDILAFEETYRKQVCKRDSHVVPPNLDRNAKVPIDDLYVAPRLFRQGARDDGSQSLPYAAFVDEIDRTVVLGDPGAGKSTLAVKLCHDLAMGGDLRTYRELHLTPILVILRDYGADRKTHSSSILDFIENTARIKYQLPSVPDGAFDYLLHTGRALVIFDGLDELLDSSYRQVVSGDVETFAALYAASPVMVTSRRIGYEQAPLDPQTFQTYGMAEFDEDQVETYARNWFAIDTGLSPAERDVKVEGFVRESLIVPDLRANPLMLGLMCNLYGGANYIPANRPDVYEKCAVMLFERWDRSRGITVEMPFESRLRPAMQHLAHWIYLDEALQSGVTRTQLIAEATNYLFPRQFDDENVAREAAGQFVDVCKGRAWVFTDTGLTPSNEPLFQFTHRTFLEYFCADYLARRFRSPADLVGSLVPRIEQREWDVVSQLAVQVKTRYVEDAEDEMLDIVLADASDQTGQAKTNLLLFAGRSLEFLVPSPRCIERVVAACVAEALAIASPVGLAVGDEIPPHQTRPADRAAELLATFGLAGRENWATMLKALEARLAKSIEEDQPVTATLACELAHHLGTLVSGTERADREERLRQLNEAGSRVVEVSKERGLRLADDDLQLRMDVVIAGQMPVTALAGQGNEELLFVPRFMRVFRNAIGVPVAVAAVFGATSTEERWYWWPRHAQSIVMLSEIGRLLTEQRPPWVIQRQMGIYSWLSRNVSFDMERLVESDAKFALLATVAVAIELEATGGITWPTEGSVVGRSVSDVLAGARSESDAGQAVETLIVGLAPEQARLLREWCRGEVDFIAAPVPTEARD